VLLLFLILTRDFEPFKAIEGIGWNADHQLTSAIVNGVNAVMRYDGLGNRLSIVENGFERRFILDRGPPLSQVLAETDAAGNILAHYVYGLGLVERIAADNTSATYHFNLVGTTLALTDANGAVTDAYSYDAAFASRSSKSNLCYNFRLSA